MFRYAFNTICLAALTFTVGCHKHKDPAPPANATRLTYIEPSSTSWHFSKISGSGSSTDPMIFELKGPAIPVKGVAFFGNLGQTPKIGWHALSGESYAQATQNLALGNDPKLFKDKLTGNILQVGAFQKSGTFDASKGVIRVALKLVDTLQKPGDCPIQFEKIAILLESDEIKTETFAFGSLKAE